MKKQSGKKACGIKEIKKTKVSGEVYLKANSSPTKARDYDDNPEWTAADVKQAMPFEDLPKGLQSQLKAVQKRGRPPVAAPKQMIAFRLAPELITAIKGSGRGYGQRVEKLLREAVEKGKL